MKLERSILRRRSRRFLLRLGLGFGAAIALAACGGSGEAPTDAAGDEAEGAASDGAPLRIGVNKGNVPWEFIDETGELVGFEVELARAVGDRLGREVEFVDMAFIDLFPALLSQRIDAAMSSITITEERLEAHDFAQPYYDSDQSLTVRSDSGITSLEDMQGKVVAVDNTSTGDLWAQENRDRYGFAEIARYEGLNPAMQDLEAGVFDGYVSDIPATLYYTKDRPDLSVVERISTGEQYSVMFAKDSPLRDEFDAAISALKEDGTLAEIYARWFGKPPEPGSSTTEVLPVPGAAEPQSRRSPGGRALARRSRGRHRAI